MQGNEATTDSARERHWFIVGRWEEYEGESRANLLRIVAIGVFYLVQLVNYEVFGVGTAEFHRGVTALAVAWTMVALAILLCLRRRIFPAALKFVSTGCDLVLLTSVLMMADGPQSPLVVGYFLIIALATLRFKLRLIWFTTIGAMGCYVFLLGYAKWYEPEKHVLRHEQLIVLVGLALTGVVLGQVIRRVRRVADYYVQRLEAIAATAGSKGDS